MHDPDSTCMLQSHVLRSWHSTRAQSFWLGGHYYVPSSRGARTPAAPIKYTVNNARVASACVGHGASVGKHGQARAQAATTLTPRPQSVRNRPVSLCHRATSSMSSKSHAWPPLCTCRIGVRRARQACTCRRTGGYHAHSATSKRQDSADVLE